MKKEFLLLLNIKLVNGFKFKNQDKNIDCWCESTISKILKNEMYIGNLVQGYNRKVSYKSSKSKIQKNKIIVPNTHEPIITKEQFYNVQNIFKSKIKRCKNGEIHLFVNKLICLDCGSKLYKCQNDRGYIFFSCKGAKKIYGNCTTHSIGYEKLKEIVTAKIRENILAYYDFDNVPNNLFETKNNLNKITSLQKKKETLVKALDKISNAIKELYLNKVSNKILEDTFEELISSFLSDKCQKQNELDKIENELLLLNEKELSSKFINEQKEKIIASFKNFKELNYDIVNSFIDYIEIGEKYSVTDDSSTIKNVFTTQNILIHWNF